MLLLFMIVSPLAGIAGASIAGWSCFSRRKRGIGLIAAAAGAAGSSIGGIVLLAFGPAGLVMSIIAMVLMVSGKAEWHD